MDFREAAGQLWDYVGGEELDYGVGYSDWGAELLLNYYFFISESRLLHV